MSGARAVIAAAVAAAVALPVMIAVLFLAVAGGSHTGAGPDGTPVPAGKAASTPQVRGWIRQAVQIMEKHGVPAAALDQNAIALIIKHESGERPTAVNLSDINAQEGHASQGLMQVIPSTFSQYALPGYKSSILDPVDNIIAGCKYAIDRYGSLDKVPGVVRVEQGLSYVGY